MGTQSVEEELPLQLFRSFSTRVTFERRFDDQSIYIGWYSALSAAFQQRPIPALMAGHICLRECNLSFILKLFCRFK